jgi:hypothetical protein
MEFAVLFFSASFPADPKHSSSPFIAGFLAFLSAVYILLNG